jgi:hypothetical protein
MMDRHPSGHLVVGIVDGGSARQAANLVTKLLEHDRSGWNQPDRSCLWNHELPRARMG